MIPNLFDSYAKAGHLRGISAGSSGRGRGHSRLKDERTMAQCRTVGVYSPPFGFEHDAEETNYILGRIALCRPDVVVVGLGAPKQEVWVHQNIDLIQAKVAFCVGATIDFLAGEKQRAPVWMQKSGVEWLHRMMTEPKRLVARYAKDAVLFPRIVYKQWLSQIS